MSLTRRRLLLLGTGLAGGVITAGCTDPSDSASGPIPPPSSTASGGTSAPTATPTASPGSATPTAAQPTSAQPTPAKPTPSKPTPSKPTPTEPPLPRVRDRRSLPALMRTDFGSGRPDRRTRQLRTARYTKYAVRYPSGKLTISGILYVPRGKGPFPAIVLNHGYINPSTYWSGQGMPREQEFLANRGFVVLHTDYRGHAQSSRASALDRELRLGYAADAINAAYALKEMPQVDPDKVAMFGRSMGGGVTMNALVAAPGVVKAGVLWASVSSSFTDNYDKWTRPERGSTADELTRRWGKPDDDRRFYADLSPRTYFDRITEPVLVEHGIQDRTCPIRWSERTVALMDKAGVDVRFRRRRGEDHTYVGRWRAAMGDTYDFLGRQLDL